MKTHSKNGQGRAKDCDSDDENSDGNNRRLSLKIVLPPMEETLSEASSQGFMDAGPGTVNGYDMDKEYDHVMAQAMQAYLDHTRDQDVEEEVVKTTRTVQPTPRREWKISPEWSRADVYRPVQSARLSRAIRVPPTVSMNQELDILERSTPALRPKRRPLTATRIRYPITGKMSQYPFVTNKSRSEHTTPVKIPKPPAGLSSNGVAQSPSSSGSYSYGGGLFLKYGNRPRDFIIHPDWVSEHVQIAQLSISKRNEESTQEYKYCTYPPRRCQSAPPNNRNPITWKY